MLQRPYILVFSVDKQSRKNNPFSLLLLLYDIDYFFDPFLYPFILTVLIF